MEEIHGRRVVLVELRSSDAEELEALLDDPFIRGALAVDDIEGLRRRFAAWESRRSPDGGQTWLNWVVRSRDDRRALGWAQATVQGATASVAYALLGAERGHGYASDAVRAVTGRLRATPGVSEVTATIAEENPASERVARAAGFTPTDRRSGGERVWVVRPAARGSAEPRRPG